MQRRILWRKVRDVGRFWRWDVEFLLIASEVGRCCSVCFPCVVLVLTCHSLLTKRLSTQSGVLRTYVQHPVPFWRPDLEGASMSGAKDKMAVNAIVFRSVFASVSYRECHATISLS